MKSARKRPTTREDTHTPWAHTHTPTTELTHTRLQREDHFSSASMIHHTSIQLPSAIDLSKKKKRFPSASCASVSLRAATRVPPDGVLHKLRSQLWVSDN